MYVCINAYTYVFLETEEHTGNTGTFIHCPVKVKTKMFILLTSCFSPFLIYYMVYKKPQAINSYVCIANQFSQKGESDAKKLCMGMCDVIRGTLFPALRPTISYYLNSTSVHNAYLVVC